MAEAALKVAAQPIQMDQQQLPVYRADKPDQEARGRVPYQKISSPKAEKVNRMEIDVENMEEQARQIGSTRRNKTFSNSKE